MAKSGVTILISPGLDVGLTGECFISLQDSGLDGETVRGREENVLSLWSSLDGGNREMSSLSPGLNGGNRGMFSLSPGLDGCNWRMFSWS